MQRTFLRRDLAAALVLASLLPTCPDVAAAVFTVGAGGTHSSVQAALDAAIAAPGEDEVRIASGTWLERVGVAQTVADRTTVSGGWTAGFTIRVADPTLTVIDAQDAGSAFRVSASAGYVEVSNLRARGQTRTTTVP